MVLGPDRSPGGSVLIRRALPLETSRYLPAISVAGGFTPVKMTATSPVAGTGQRGANEPGRTDHKKPGHVDASGLSRVGVI